MSWAQAQMPATVCLKPLILQGSQFHHVLSSLSCYGLLYRILARKLLEVWDICCFVLSSFPEAQNDTEPRASTLSYGQIRSSTLHNSLCVSDYHSPPSRYQAEKVCILIDFLCPQLLPWWCEHKNYFSLNVKFHKKVCNVISLFVSQYLFF